MRGRILLRGLVAQRGGLVALALAALAAALLATAFPRYVALLLDRDVRFRVEAQGTVRRDLVANVTPGDVALATEQLTDVLATVRSGFGPALRHVAAPARALLRADGTGFGGAPSGVAVEPVPGAPDGDLSLSLEADPRLRSDAVLVAGRWPTPAVPPAAVPVVLAARTAASLHWRVGETRRLLLLHGTQVVRLVGLIRPRHAADDIWQLDPTRAQLGVTPRVNIPPRLHAVAWTDPATFGEVGGVLGGRSALAWFPVRAARIDAAAVPGLRVELARAVADITAFGGEPPQLLRLSSGLGDALDDAAASTVPATALIAVIAAGPLGAAVAVLAAAVRVLATRRAPALELARARGGSPPTIAALFAAEVAVASVAGAAIGALAGVLLLPGRPLDPTGMLAVALLPPALAAVSTLPSAGARTRAVAEVLVLLLAVASVVALLRGGFGARSGSGPDPLLVLTPVLVALAVALLLLRLQPAALALLGRALHGTRGSVAFVGRAVAGAGGAWPTLAVVLAVAVAALSLVVLGTERGGGQDAARSEVGADLVVAAPALTESALARIRAVPGVTAIAPLRAAGAATIDESRVSDVAVYLADARSLAVVEARGSAPTPVAGRLTARSASPVAVGQVGLAAGRHEVDIGRSRFPVQLTVAERPTGAIQEPDWLLLDEARVPSAVREGTVTTVVLVALRPGTDDVAVRRAVDRAAPGAAIDTTVARAAFLRSAPLVGGAEAVVAAALLASCASCAIGIGVTLAARGRSRARLLATLRSLGFSRRQSLAVVGWELGPQTAAAIVAGVATGVALALLLVGAIDLRPFTGGDARPAPTVDPVALLVLAAGFGAAAAVAVLVVVRRSAARPDAALREGD